MVEGVGGEILFGGGEVVAFAEQNLCFAGFHQVRFNRFPSRAAFMAVVFDPSRLEVQHEHREVAMSDTYTLIVRPQIDTLPASWEGLVDG